MVTTDIGMTDSLGAARPSDDEAAAVAVYGDGRIVVAGTSAGLFAVVRYTATAVGSASAEAMRRHSPEDVECGPTLPPPRSAAEIALVLKVLP